MVISYMELITCCGLRGHKMTAGREFADICKFLFCLLNRFLINCFPLVLDFLVLMANGHCWWASFFPLWPLLWSICCVWRALAHPHADIQWHLTHIAVVTEIITAFYQNMLSNAKANCMLTTTVDKGVEGSNN